MSYTKITKRLKELAAENVQAERFFKTGSNSYSAHDVFIGVCVPDQRTVAKEFRDASFADLEKLLTHKIHEYRLTALYILADQFKRGDHIKQKEVHDFYIKHIDHVNNWDLVDESAPKLAGMYFLDRSKREYTAFLETMSNSSNLWHNRIAVLSTFPFIRRNEISYTLKIAKKLLFHPHDLIHKAVGWMLREVGKQDEQALRAFLDRYIQQMPRTMVRYAIEKLPAKVRKHYITL